MISLWLLLFKCSRRIKDTTRRRHAQKQLSLKKLLGRPIKSHTEKPWEKTEKIKSFQEEVGASIWARHKSDYPWRNSWSNQSVRAIERNLASKTKPGSGFCFSVNGNHPDPPLVSGDLPIIATKSIFYDHPHFHFPSRTFNLRLFAKLIPIHLLLASPADVWLRYSLISTPWPCVPFWNHAIKMPMSSSVHWYQ